MLIIILIILRRIGIEDETNECKVLSTQMPFSKVRVFVVVENASVDSRPHYRFDGFRLSTPKRSKTI